MDDLRAIRTRRREGVQDPGLHRILLQDVGSGDVLRHWRRDLEAVYRFYLDEEQRARLASMGRLRRALWVAGWLGRSFIRQLSPTRRLMVLLSLLLLLIRHSGFTAGGVALSIDLTPFAYALLLLVLMLELRDKLIARDEIEVARDVQRSLLPSAMPELPGWQIWFVNQPANDVGGDLVDTFALSHERLALMLGDVAGKGLGAALLMAKLQATLRAVAPDAGALDELARRVNRIVCRDGMTNRFATLAYLELHASRGEVRLLNAGHIPPLVVTRNGAMAREPVALPLGIVPEAVYIEESLVLAPGDALVLVSDGVTEATNGREEMFGHDRLLALAAQSYQLAPDALGRAIAQAVDRFIEGVRPNDDLSIVIARFTGASQA